MENAIDTLVAMLAAEREKYTTFSDAINDLVMKQKTSEEKIAHYEKLISLEGGVGNAPQGHGKTTIIRRRTTFPGSAASAQRNLIDGFTGEYTINSVKEEFEKKFPSMIFSKNVFHGIIQDRIEKGTTVLEKQGLGRAPSIYRNIGQMLLIDTNK